MLRSRFCRHVVNKLKLVLQFAMSRDVTSRLKWVYKLDCATPTHKCTFQSKKNLADEGCFMTYGKSYQ